MRKLIIPDEWQVITVHIMESEHGLGVNVAQIGISQLAFFFSHFKPRSDKKIFSPSPTPPPSIPHTHLLARSKHDRTASILSHV